MNVDPALFALLHLRHPDVASNVLATRLREAAESLAIVHGDNSHQRVLSLASALVERSGAEPSD